MEKNIVVKKYGKSRSIIYTVVRECISFSFISTCSHEHTLVDSKYEKLCKTYPNRTKSKLHFPEAISIVARRKKIGFNSTNYLPWHRNRSSNFILRIEARVKIQVHKSRVFCKCDFDLGK